MAIIDDKIRDEKLQYNIDRQAAKKSALSSWKIGKYESLTGEEMLLTDQKRVIKQAKLTYFPLEKKFEIQTKRLKRKEEKQVKALKALMEEELESIEGSFPKITRTDEIKNEIDEIKKKEKIKLIKKIWNMIQVQINRIFNSMKQ